MSIALVVLGHSPAGLLEVDWLAWLKAARIPFFFFLSGILISESKSLIQIAQNKFNSLLVPYLTGCAIALTGAGLLHQSIPGAEKILGVFYGSFFYLEWGPLWFLPHLFIVVIAFGALRRRLGNKLSSSGAMVTFITLAFLWPIILEKIWKIEISVFGYTETILGWPFGFDYLPITLSFFGFGYCMRKTLKQTFNLTQLVPVFMVVALLALINAALNSNSIELALRNYDHWFFSSVSAVLGIVFLIALSFVVENISGLRKIFLFLGANSLVILIFHEVIQRRAFDLILKTSGMGEIGVGVVAFLIALIMPLLASKLFFEKVGIMRYAILGKRVDKPAFLNRNTAEG